MGLVNLVYIPAESDDIVTQVDGFHFSGHALPAMLLFGITFQDMLRFTVGEKKPFVPSLAQAPKERTRE